MKKVIALQIALLLIPRVAVGDLDWVDFTVTRHVNTTTFTAAIFDAAMSDINDRLRLDDHDCSDDVPCTVRFTRSVPLGTFGTTGDGLDIITTQAELTSVFGVTTHRAKVVDGVDYCADSYNTSFVGCGRCNGFGFIVEDWVGGNVYVHEFGHNVNLWNCAHRDDCAFNIMNTFTTGANNSVNSAECAGFGGQVYAQLCGNVSDGAGGPLTVSAGPYWVTCNLTVPSGSNLTINPGVEVQLEPGLNITSYGSTTGDGTINRINIYSNNEGKNFPGAIVDGPLLIGSGGVLTLD